MLSLDVGEPQKKKVLKKKYCVLPVENNGF